MDLEEFKDAITCKNPLFNDLRFGASLYPPKITKIVPDFAKTDEELVKLIRFEVREREAVEKMAKDMDGFITDVLKKATEQLKKYIIFIKAPEHMNVVQVIDDLAVALRDRRITNIKRDYVKGEVETDHVIAKIIMPWTTTQGLRCDQCFGFPYEEAILLKRNPLSGYEHLTSVPPYIEYIEKEKTKEMRDTALNRAQELGALMGTVKSTTNPSKPAIKNVIFNDPATIVMWSDGTKTVVKAEKEDFDPEKGLAMAISKKNLGNKYDYYNTFKHWLKKYYKDHPDYGRYWKVPSEPVHKAYTILNSIITTKPTKPELEAAIQEAIGLLGEALDD